MKTVIRTIVLLAALLLCFSAISCNTNDDKNSDKTLYELAVEGGYKGTEAEWGALLNNADKTVYELAVDGGFKGTEAEWNALLNNAGKTLYELATEAGYEGSAAEWEALINNAGKTLYELAVEAGYKGSEADFEALINGDKKTLYELAVEGGYKGTEVEWEKLINSGNKTLFEGAIASCVVTLIGHYPWFVVHNYLNKYIPYYNSSTKNLLRNAAIGFCCSLVSDTITNSLRVIKTKKQTSKDNISYIEAINKIIEEEGIKGIFLRGLGVRIITNGVQSLMFNILWKYFESGNRKTILGNVYINK